MKPLHAGWPTWPFRCRRTSMSSGVHDACVPKRLGPRGAGPPPPTRSSPGGPSLTRPELVPDFARRLAARLGLPFAACVVKTIANQPQKEMRNSFQQARNLDGVFVVDRAQLLAGPVLLVDDMVDSRWTFTVTGALLRRAGAPAVFPLALALNSPRQD